MPLLVRREQELSQSTWAGGEDTVYKDLEANGHKVCGLRWSLEGMLVSSGYAIAKVEG